MTDTRFRLVVMGDSYVGKSSIIKRFLYGTFNIDYVATVEDLFSQDFEVGGTCLKVDILDTAGDAQFPAMRRYICNFVIIRVVEFSSRGTKLEKILPKN